MYLNVLSRRMRPLSRWTS